MASSFLDFNLSPGVVQALKVLQITEPTAIQASVIPDALAGRDVLGRAPTGSGKTLGFGVPLLELVGEPTRRRPRGLVLAPTRELAEQIRRDLAPIAATLNRSLVAVYGGVGMAAQIAALRRGVHVVIATPGRLIDLMDQGEVLLETVDRVVVDEADRMADMGFLPDVRRILDATSADRQTLLFSATLDRAVAVLTASYQTTPVTHDVGSDDPDISQMAHRFLRVPQASKVPVTADIIAGHRSTMVFCRTRVGVDRLCRRLKDRGIRTGWIHGGRSQPQRDAALRAFTEGRVDVLVATDVAARGIHVDDVACVLHYDPPADAKDYIHRSGRTARAGSAGEVISLVTPEQAKVVASLRQKVGVEVEMEDLGAEPVGPPPGRVVAKPVAEHSGEVDRVGGRTEKANGPKRKAGRAGDGKKDGKSGGKGDSRKKSKRSGKPRPRNKSARATRNRDGGKRPGG